MSRHGLSENEEAHWQHQVFREFRLYAVTDIEREDLAILDKIDAAYQGGADIVQLRSKSLSANSLNSFFE